MVKMVVMIRRKPGTTPEDFRNYYETRHSRLMHNFADCIVDYRRSYPVRNPVAPEMFYNPSGQQSSSHDAEFDCVTEVWLKNEDALLRLYERMAEPEIAEAFRADTERFTDRSQTRFVICRECHGIADERPSGEAPARYKLVATMKRKPGTTTQAFRDYYETTHRKLASHVAQYMADYRRSYPVANPAEPGQVYNPSGKALINPENAPFDGMTEIWFADEAALVGLFGTMAQAEIARLFAEDEERFIDRSTTRIVICQECHGYGA